MLKIFDKNHNAIGHIVKYKDCKIESELSTGDKTLYFTYLAKHHSLTNEMYVRTKDDEYVRVYCNDEFIGTGKLLKNNNTISLKSDKIFIE